MTLRSTRSRHSVHSMAHEHSVRSACAAQQPLTELLWGSSWALQPQLLRGEEWEGQGLSVPVTTADQLSPCRPHPLLGSFCQRPRRRTSRQRRPPSLQPLPPPLPPHLHSSLPHHSSLPATPLLSEKKKLHLEFELQKLEHPLTFWCAPPRPRHRSSHQPPPSHPRFKYPVSTPSAASLLPPSTPPSSLLAASFPPGLINEQLQHINTSTPHSLFGVLHHGRGVAGQEALERLGGAALAGRAAVHIQPAAVQPRGDAGRPALAARAAALRLWPPGPLRCCPIVTRTPRRRCTATRAAALLARSVECLLGTWN